MRPMVLLASALFPSLILAGIQAGCSSDDNNAPPVNTPPDSGPIVVPEAGPSAQPVTVIISGKGLVVSNDGFPEDGGPNGYVNGDGGAPVVDCPGSCVAPQGTTIYAYPQVGTYFADGGVNQPGYVFAGWTTSDGGVTVSTFSNLQIGPYTSSPITANFVLTPSGPDASITITSDGGPTQPFPEAGPVDNDSGSEDSGTEDTGTTDSATPATDGGDAG
jgi:uncharacterized repeat protein (TIGR02543 family)